MTPTLAHALAWLLPAAVFLAAPAPATSKPAPPATLEPVPDQPWYPPGYRDLRIAAEGTMQAFPRDLDWVMSPDWDNPHKKTYDVIDCNLGYDLEAATDNQEGWRQLLALDVARMRTEFHKLGYRQAVYDQPLLDHERTSLAFFAEAKPRPLPVETVGDQDGAEPTAQDDETEYYDSWWGLDTLAEKLEANRKRLQPNKPRIIMEGGCGAGEAEFTVELSPPTGHLWLINAFAFKVCERKVPNPWDHGACSWGEFESGEKTTASGRYMYEARWPDGTVRRGAKDLHETEDGAAIVIRRN